MARAPPRSPSACGEDRRAHHGLTRAREVARPAQGYTQKAVVGGTSLSAHRRIRRRPARECSRLAQGGAACARLSTIAIRVSLGLQYACRSRYVDAFTFTRFERAACAGQRGDQERDLDPRLRVRELRSRTSRASTSRMSTRASPVRCARKGVEKPAAARHALHVEGLTRSRKQIAAVSPSRKREGGAARAATVGQAEGGRWG